MAFPFDQNVYNLIMEALDHFNINNMCVVIHARAEDGVL